MIRFATTVGFALATTIAAPAGSVAIDWSKRTAATTDGGFVMGNPTARVTLVEYGSLTCPHCRQFAASATKPLTANYVRTGKVRFEFRNYILNGYDLSASLIARCGGARTFFPAAEAIYASQEQWLGKVRALPRARYDEIEAMDGPRKLSAMADVTGLRALAAAKGIPVAASNRCLSNAAAAQRLVDLTNAANSKYDVAGTPTFFVNGKRVDGADWASVEAAIKAAL